MARRIGLALGIALGLVLLVLIALLGVAQTAPGKRLIAAGVERALAGPDTTAELTGLEGFVPFDLRLERLTMADAAGPWLELADVRLAWSPRALLRGRLQVEEVGAAELRLLRLPPSRPEEEPDDAPFRLPELPDSLPPVVVERLALERIELGPEVVGQAASFTLSGRLAAAEDGRSATLALNAERLDRPTARASVEARLELDPAALNLEVSAAETGGLLAALTDEPQAGDFFLELAGAGPLDGWSGDLELTAEGLAQADARLELALAEAPTLQLEATVRPAAGVLPEDFVPLIGERLGVALTARQTAAQRVVVSDLELAIAVATLTGAGEVDFDSNQFSATAALQAPDLAPLGALIETPLAGALQADLSAEGALLQPNGRLQLALERPALEPVAAEHIETTLDFAALAPLDERAAVEIEADGRAQSLRLPPEVPLPPQDLTWRLDASGAVGGAIAVRALTLAAEHVALQASGALDAGTLAGDAKIGLRVDALAPLTAPFGQRLEGELALDADVKIAAGAEEIAVDLTGGAAALAGLPPAAATLLGAVPQLAAEAAFRPGEGLEVSRLALDGTAASLGGALALSLPEQGLDGELTLDVPQLAALAPALGQDLAGTLAIVARPGGTLDAPTLEARLQGRNLLLAGRPVERVTVATAARDLLAAPAGHLEATLAAAGLEVALAGDYALRDGELRASGLQLTAPGTRIGGDLALDLERTLIDGALRGEVADLAAFEPLLPVALAGQLTLAAELAAAGPGQAVDLSLDGSGLAGAFGSLQNLSLRAEVADALGAPRIDADLAIDAFRQGGTVVDSAALGASGTLEELALTLAADGEALAPFTLDGRARLALGAAVRLRLEQLGGSFAGQPVRLAQPAELTLVEGGTQLAGLDLRLGDARLQASADLGPQEVSADATLAGLPLELLARFGAPPLTGQAGARLQLSGAADNPQGTLELSLDQLRAADAAFAELPPARLRATAALAERRLSVDLQGEGVTEQPITLSAELPLVVRLDQLVLELPEDGRLSGRLAAELALARLAALAALDDQTLSGLMAVDATLGGTVGAPELQGDLELSDGAYANGTTGTVLREMTLAARATAQQIVIERFAATDGGNGTLSGEGSVAVDPAASFPVALRVDLSRARLVRREDVDATVSGELQLEGATTALTLAGDLTVDRAEIQIPEQAGPRVAVIEVEEIGVDGAEIPATGGQADALALALDLTVELPGRVFVRGRGLESEWGGRLQATGTAAAPRLVGDLELRRGHLDFLDRRLELRQGVISFGGDTPPDPTIRIEATTSVAELTVVVRITGQALQPTLTLDSEPALPEDEILARLLFQRETSQMTPAQAAQLALAVNRLRGGGAGLLGRARELLGVDRLDFAGGETAAGSTVRAGKYLGDDVYLEVERGAASGTGRARVEVEILPNVSIEADTGADAQSGVGVQWRYDF